MAGTAEKKGGGRRDRDKLGFSFGRLDFVASPTSLSSARSAAECGPTRGVDIRALDTPLHSISPCTSLSISHSRVLYLLSASILTAYSDHQYIF